VTWIAVLGGGGGNGDGDATAATGDGCEYDKRYNTEGFIVETYKWRSRRRRSIQLHILRCNVTSPLSIYLLL
jgi:hypothetical protein